MNQGIPINHEVLIWARERAGYSLNQLIRTIPKLGDWEKGITFPTYSQLEELSKKYKVTMAIFFFPAPPKEEPIEKSLRSITEKDVLSPQVRFLFRKGKAFQIYLRELLFREQQRQYEKLSWLKERVNRTPNELAQHVRNILKISLDVQFSWKNSDSALMEWRKALANNGIYVFKEAFKNEKISGFCIYDDMVPIIFINSSQSKNRQIFTIFHELAHLFFKENYLDIFDQELLFDDNNFSSTEAKCNSFAGCFLVPDDDFEKKSQKINFGQDIEKLSEMYKVSKEVILRKLLNNKKITKKVYLDKVREWKDLFERENKTEAKGGGNFYANKLQYIGDAYCYLVFKEYRHGSIDIEKASEYLDIKPKSFLGIESVFLKRDVSDVRL